MTNVVRARNSKEDKINVVPSESAHASSGFSEDCVTLLIHYILPTHLSTSMILLGFVLLHFKHTR